MWPAVKIVWNVADLFPSRSVVSKICFAVGGWHLNQLQVWAQFPRLVTSHVPAMQTPFHDLSKRGFCEPQGRSQAHRFTPNALASYDTALHHHENECHGLSNGLAYSWHVGSAAAGLHETSVAVIEYSIFLRRVCG